MDDAALSTAYLSGTTLTQLALLAKSTKDRVRTRLKKLGIYTQQKIHKYSLPEMDICELYKQDVAVQDIATSYHTSTQPIVSILSKYKIRKPNQFKSLPYCKYIQVIDREFFVNVVNEHISKANVAVALGLNYDMVATLYKYHGLSGTSSSNIRSKLNQKKANVPLSKESFIDLHYNQCKSISQISNDMGVSVGYLRNLMRDEWVIDPLPQGEVRLSSEFRTIRDNIEDLADEVAKYPVLHLCKKYNVSADVMFRTLKEHSIDLPFRSRSLGEQQIVEFIQQLLPNEQIHTCDRTIIYPHELDIFIPHKNIAIEYCGLYWHSDARGKDNKYHISKLQQCNDKGIRLLTIFDDEYTNKPTLVQARIAHALGVMSSIKINARQCVVKEITARVKNEFLDINHLQGSDICKYSLGLFYADELVSVMTFARPSRARNSAKNMSADGLWELNRFASHTKYHVRGAAGKLLKHFQRNYPWSEIFSYADRRWSDGDLYTTLGFTLISTSKPNYWYLDKTFKKREYRFNYTKCELVKQGFDPNSTETAIMKERGYCKIWDCGALKFSIIKKPP